MNIQERCGYKINRMPGEETRPGIFKTTPVIIDKEKGIQIYYVTVVSDGLEIERGSYVATNFTAVEYSADPKCRDKVCDRVLEDMLGGNYSPRVSPTGQEIDTNECIVLVPAYASPEGLTFRLEPILPSYVEHGTNQAGITFQNPN